MRATTSLTAVALAALTSAETFTNPVLWEDLADNEVIRVDNDFYMTASTMHYSPGAPVLHSTDLVNWAYVGHSVPSLDYSDAYNLTSGTNAYVKGIWASSIRHRPLDNLFYYLACVEFGTTYIYSSSSPSGPWTQLPTPIPTCYYDAGLLFDDDEAQTPYVAYGNSEIHVAQLSPDLSSQVADELVFTTPDSIGYLEGSRFYKKDGSYYIFVTKPATAQYIIKSSSSSSSPLDATSYGDAVLVADSLTLTSVPNAGNPHQGSLVDTPSGQWYYMGFSDMYPGGRCPVLAPVTWEEGGYPVVQLDGNGQWGDYDYPLTPSGGGQEGTLGRKVFDSIPLADEWEWNHNPDTNSISLVEGTTQLMLNTVTVTDDLYQARNTLTHRIHGPVGTGTVQLDVSGMVAGDRAGLAVLRDLSAWVGVQRGQDGTDSLVVVTGLAMEAGDSQWETSSTGEVVASVSASDALGNGTSSFETVHLRVKADIQPGGSGIASFSYSVDGGSTFTDIGLDYGLSSEWEFFMGYRYGIFNHATTALGGNVKVVDFTSA